MSTNLRKRVFLALIGCLLTGGLVGVAHADDPAAEEHNVNGKIAYGKGDLQEALTEFQAAFLVDPQPKYLFNTAKTLERLGRVDEAFRAYEDYLRRIGGADEREVAARTLVRLCAEVGGGVVKVTSAPEGAAILADGEPFPLTAPASICLSEGDHELTMSKTGLTPVSVEIGVDARSHQEVKVALERPAGKGTVRVESSLLPATVRLDGKDLGAAPREVEVAADGRHELVVEAGEGHEPWFATIAVEGGQTVTLQAYPQATQGPAMATGEPFNYGWVTLGAGIAAVVTGAVLYGVAYDRFKTADELDPTQPGYSARFDDLINEGGDMQIGAYVTLGAGALMAIPTVLLWESGEPNTPIESALGPTLRGPALFLSYDVQF